MRLVILDPNLEGTFGHHAQYDRVICAEARRRGMDAIIIGNRKFPDKYLSEIPVWGLLNITCYQTFSSDPLFGTIDDVELGNAAVLADMEAVASDFFRESDLVLCPTVTQTTLLGVLSWLLAFSPRKRPSLTVMLMFPSGVSVDEDGKPFIYDEAAALGYRRAFQLVKENNLRVDFFATGRQHAKEFSVLSGWNIESHALISAFDEATVPEVKKKQVLLAAGDAKMNKGLALLPDIIRELLPRHPEYQFVLHANPGPAWGQALELIKTLEDLAPNHTNLDMRLGELSSSDYVDLLGTSEVVLLPYDPVEYARKSSGVTWEAIASGAVAVVTDKTWLAHEAALWQTAYCAFSPYEAGAAVAALEKAISGLATLGPKAKAASQAMRAVNGAKHLLDQITDHWLSRHVNLGANPSAAFDIPCRAFDGEGWYPTENYSGRDVRWSSKRAKVRVKLPVSGGWRFTFRGANRIGDEQIFKAEIEVDGDILPTQGKVTRDGWTVSAMFRERRMGGPQHEVTLSLPWDYRPPSDNRDLGVLAHNLEVTPDENATTDLVTIIECMSPTLPLVAGSWSAPVRHCTIDLRFDPRRDHEVVLCLPQKTSPAVARRAEGFVGGRPVSLRVDSAGDWRLRFLLPARVLDGRYLHTFDLVLPEAAPLRLEGVGYAQPSSAPVASEAAATAVVPQTPDKTALVQEPVSPVVADAPAQPVPAPSPDDAPTVSEPSDPPKKPDPRQEPSVVFPDQPALTAEFGDHRISDISQIEDLSVMTLNLSGSAFQGIRMNRLFIRLLRSKAYAAIEFRERDGAFQLFSQAPVTSVKQDDFGKFLMIFIGSNGTARLDHEMLKQLADGVVADLLAVLPKIVAGATPDDGVTLNDRQAWVDQAQMIQAAVLGELTAPAR